MCPTCYQISVMLSNINRIKINHNKDSSVVKKLSQGNSAFFNLDILISLYFLLQ